MPSDFNSNATQSAWWLLRDSSGQWVTVLSTGNAVVRTLQGLLRLSLGSSGMTTYDGSTIRASDITVDGNWGPNTYKGLWAVANNLGASDSQKTIIQANAEAGYSEIPRDVMEIAVGMISANLGTGASIPPDANLLPYRSVAGGFMAPLASRPSTQYEIDSIGMAAPPASPDNPTIQVQPPAPSAPAIDQTTGLPTGVPQTVSQGSGIPWGTVIAVGLGVVALGAVAMSVQQGQRHLRTNPAMGPRFARVYIERETLDRGGYTRRGRYFGTGARLYRVTGEDLVDKYGRTHGYVDEYLRAADRNAAIQKVREKYINVRFSGAV